MKKKCESYRTRKRFDILDGMMHEVGYCLGTKEQECCNCGGDEANCDFYSYIRERASYEQTNTIESKTTKTYMTKAEIVYAVNEAANKQNKIVPAEFYEKLFGGN